MYIYDKQSDTMHRNHQKHSNLENRREVRVFKAELPPAEVDPPFDICRIVNKPLQKKTLRQFWSDRFETNRTWALILGLHVLFVSKRKLAE